MAKVMLLTGSLVGYAYAIEFFIAWYGGNLYERFAFINRAIGPYAWASGPDGAVQRARAAAALVASACARTSPLLFVVSILVNVGMWFERFVIIVTSLHRAYLPSSWVMYTPTLIEVGIAHRQLRAVLHLFLLFIRFLPMIAMWEIKGLVGARAERRRAGVAVPREFLVATFSDEDSLLRGGAPLRGARLPDLRRLRALSRPRPGRGHGPPALAAAAGDARWRDSLGLASPLALQFYAAVFDWPLNVGGKPDNSTLAFVPIAFELTVLFARAGHGGRLPAARAAVPGRASRASSQGVTEDVLRAGAAPSATDARRGEARRLLWRAAPASVERRGR